jgi:hypothetical protein
MNTNKKPSFVSIRVHSRLTLVSIRGIETLNDSDEGLLHGGIRQVGGTNTALQGVRCIESNEFPAID